MRRLLAFVCFVLTAVAIACGGGDVPTAPTAPSQPTASSPAVPPPSFNTATNEAGMSISTDKDDYQPGDTVRITGSGWWAGETVNLLIEEDPEATGPHQFSSVADETGTFENTDLVITEEHLEVTFTLTATGESSGGTVQTTFTDHGASPVTSTSFSITKNASHLVTVSVTLGGGSGTVTLTAATAKVANVTASTTIDVVLTSPGTPGNGIWTGSFQGECGTEYKINNVGVTWTTTHDHNSTQTPGGTVSTTTDACPPTNTPPTAEAAGPYEGDEGEWIQLDGSGSSDPDAGDVITYKWTVDATGIDASGVCTFDDDTKVDAKVRCTDDSQQATGGKFNLTLKVTDSHDAFDTDDADLTVDNVAPSVSITAPADYSVWAITATQFGSAGFVNAPFSDDGKNDTHTCTIDWGDGDGAVNGTVTETQGAGTGTCTSAAGNPYTDDGAGIYDITVKVKDDDNVPNEGSASVTIVVYDPSAGFVTGGGWINSLAGYCKKSGCQDAEGKAHFGFVSKYQKGATIPTGQTEFQFQAGDLNFHSAVYEWLIVNKDGTNAQYKGTGTINGANDTYGNAYKFMLWGYDGTKVGGYDTFRIRIWSEWNGYEDVVYDNGGSGAGGYSTAAIANGSIQVQTGKK